MHQNTEPLYVGVDVDTLLTQLDQDSHRCSNSRRAGGRRLASKYSPLAENLEARIALQDADLVALSGARLA